MTARTAAQRTCGVGVGKEREDSEHPKSGHVDMLPECGGMAYTNHVRWCSGTGDSQGLVDAAHRPAHHERGSAEARLGGSPTRTSPGSTARSIVEYPKNGMTNRRLLHRPVADCMESAVDSSTECGQCLQVGGEQWLTGRHGIGGIKPSCVDKGWQTPADVSCRAGVRQCAALGSGLWAEHDRPRPRTASPRSPSSSPPGRPPADHHQ